MHIMLIVPSLEAGGAEHVAALMGNYWRARNQQVTLLTYDDGAVPPFYDLDPLVRHIPLSIARDSGNSLQGLWNNLKRIRALRSAIRQCAPNIIISFMDSTNVVTLLATRGLGIPVLVSEHVEPTIHSIPKVWKRLRLWAYPSADAIIVLSQRSVNYFKPRLRSKVRVIPNPVVTPPESSPSAGPFLRRPAVIAMGRLVEQKGFDLLLHAFARVKDAHPQWTLTILGEGPLRQELETLRSSLGLLDRVYLPGQIKNPYHIFNEADLFVMSSRYEGFPLVLCEAMACGLPVISTDCPTGPQEIIVNNVSGILVPNEDVKALAAAMSRLMSDEQERKRIAASARLVRAQFGIEKVMKMWEDLIEQVLRD
ncbi:MAG TPA: glycosyltransferase family 4 protein [Pyrinomonadaceae bacterium]|jgi:glycosyltransferase involved in cell wall biosynthesis